MKNLWLWFLARFRIDMGAVCEQSEGRGLFNDFHDYPDSVEFACNGWTIPHHFHVYTCVRCGKRFTI